MTRNEALEKIKELETYLKTLPPEATTFDFEDGNGPVPAARHKNPNGSEGGWVAATAKVDPTAFVGSNARVYDTAWVSGNARVSGKAWVSGNAWVSDNAHVSGKAWVSGNAHVYE